MYVSLAVGLYKLNRRAWQYSFYLIAFIFLSQVITVFTDGYAKVMDNVKVEPQIAFLKNPAFENTIMIAGIVIPFLYFPFLIYLKKYFIQKENVEVDTNSSETLL